MDKPHVFHIIDGLTFGGAETLLRDLASGLENRGYRVTVGYSTYGPFVHELEKMNLTLKYIPRLALVDPFFLTQIMLKMHEDPPQIVHTHLFKSDFHGRLAARLMKVPVIVSTLHNNDVWANNWLLGHIYGLTAIWADRLIAVSPEVKEFHIQKTGVSNNKISVIENGVDVDAFQGFEEEAKKIRLEFSIKPDAPLFGIIGRLKPQKNLPMFLLAAVQILREQPESRFLVVGDGPLYNELVVQAQALGLLPSMIFTGMRKDIKAILKSLDVLVLSSLWEGLPVILLEAMAASLPIISTDVDGVRGLLESDVTALLVPSTDHEALAKACITLAEDIEMRNRLGKAGFKHVQEKYSLTYMINQISNLYLSLLRTKGIEASLKNNVK